MERSRIIAAAELIMPAFWTILECGLKAMDMEFEGAAPFTGAHVEKLPAGVYHFTFRLAEDTSEDLEADVIGELFRVLGLFGWEDYSREGLTFAVKVKELSEEEAKARAPKHLVEV